MVSTQNASVAVASKKSRPVKEGPVDWAGRTTVMLRNIPSSYNQVQLLRELDERGFEHTYDFFYLPYDMTKQTNMGYGFINFKDPQHSVVLEATLDGKQLKNSRGRKTLQVVPAVLQGYHANYLKLQHSAVLNHHKTEHSPIFLGEIIPGPKDKKPTGKQVSKPARQTPPQSMSPPLPSAAARMAPYMLPQPAVAPQPVRNIPKRLPAPELPSDCATIRIAPVPITCTQLVLRNELNLRGYGPHVELVHIDVQQQCAIVVFNLPQWAKEAAKVFNGAVLMGSPLRVTAAPLQGLQKNLMFYAQRDLMTEKVEQSAPVPPLPMPIPGHFPLAGFPFMPPGLDSFVYQPPLSAPAPTRQALAPRWAPQVPLEEEDIKAVLAPPPGLGFCGWSAHEEAAEEHEGFMKALRAHATPIEEEDDEDEEDELPQVERDPSLPILSAEKLAEFTKHYAVLSAPSKGRFAGLGVCVNDLPDMQPEERTPEYVDFSELRASAVQSARRRHIPMASPPVVPPRSACADKFLRPPVYSPDMFASTGFPQFLSSPAFAQLPARSRGSSTDSRDLSTRTGSPELRGHASPDMFKNTGFPAMLSSPVFAFSSDPRHESSRTASPDTRREARKSTGSSGANSTEASTPPNQNLQAVENLSFILPPSAENVDEKRFVRPSSYLEAALASASASSASVLPPASRQSGKSMKKSAASKRGRNTRGNATQKVF